MNKVSSVDRVIVKRFKKLLILRGIDVISISLYGSRARGKAEKDSDMDIFILVKKLNRIVKKQIMDIAWEIGFDNSRVITTFVVDENMLQGPIKSSVIIKKILKEGVLI